MVSPRRSLHPLQNSPRRQPVQSRATATRDAVLQAAAHILTEQGLSSFNTNRVAELAGVSIGSLYQYYPNKTALLIALSEQQAWLLVQQVEHCAAAIEGQSLEEAISALLDVALDHQFAHGQLEASLDYAERETPPTPTLLAHRQSIGACLQGVLVRYSGQINGKLKETAMDLQAIVAALVDSAALRGEKNTPQLKKRLMRASMGYLTQ